jgi:WD40 repeat protein
VLAFGEAVTALAVTPDGRLLVVAIVDLGASAWTLPDGSLAFGLASPPPLPLPGPPERPHREAANALVARPDGKEALLALEGRLLRYSLDDGSLARELPLRRGVVRSVAWSPDGSRLLVSRFYDPAARIVSASDGEELARLPVEREAAAVAFSGDGRSAAVASEVGGISIFDVATASPRRRLAAGRQPPAALAFLGSAGPGEGAMRSASDAGGERLVSAGQDGVLRIWDGATGAQVAESDAGRSFSALAVSAEREMIAAGDLAGVIRLYDRGGKLVESFSAQPRTVSGLAFAGGLLVSASDGGTVALWELD